MDINKFVNKYPFRGTGRLYLLANRIFPKLKTAENLNKNKCIQLLKEGNFDIFHPTFYDDYFLKYLNGKPFVLTIHDMIPELFPKYFGQKDLQIITKKKLAQKAAAIIAVSEQTKKDIIDILEVNEDKIHVIYHGGPKIEKVNKKSPYPFPYFLYVGKRGGYKNFSQLLKDYSIFYSRNGEVKLICTGSNFTSAEKELILKYGIKDNVIHEQATDEYLRILYANAEAFIYPSLYEGFGMPILEAFAYGCPVIINKKSCFPEIAGEAAIYFESNNQYSNIAETLSSFYNSPNNFKKELIEKGYKRLSMYSWEKAANELQKVYQSILQ